MEMKYYNPSNNFRAPIPREPKPYSPPSRSQSEILVPRPVKAPYEKVKDSGAHRAEEMLKDTEYENEMQLNHKELPCDLKRETTTKHPAAAPPMNRDEWLLVGVILVLLLNGCDDYILLAVLGYLVFSFRGGDADNHTSQR